RALLDQLLRFGSQSDPSVSEPAPLTPPAPCLDLVALEQLLTDHHALDLARPLADQQQRRVTIEPLDLVLLRVAVAPVDAKSLLDDLLAGLRGEQLRHAGLDV